MKPFDRLTGIAAVLHWASTDTDAIIPSRCIRAIGREGLAEGLFANLRYGADGKTPNPNFALNQPQYRGAQILIGGENFGCGSSREQAVWALQDYGFRALVAVSYGSIFRRNCIQNGLLPVRPPAEQVLQLCRWVEEAPQQNRLEIDLPQQQVRWAGSEQPIGFDMDEDAKQMLLQGHSPVQMTLSRMARHIADFEARDARARPWLHP